MRPLLLVFWGLIVVVVDLRVGGYDVVSDVVGWLLVVYGTRQLHHRDVAFTAATAGAVLGGIGAVYQLVPGLYLAEWLVWLLGLVEILATTVLVVAVCTGIARVLAHEPSVVRQARTIRAADLVLTGVVAVVTGTSGWILREGPMLLVVLVAAFAVGTWFLVLLWRVRNRPGLGGESAQPVTA